MCCRRLQQPLMASSCVVHVVMRSSCRVTFFATPARQPLEYSLMLSTISQPIKKQCIASLKNDMSQLLDVREIKASNSLYWEAQS